MALLAAMQALVLVVGVSWFASTADLWTSLLIAPWLEETVFRAGVQTQWQRRAPKVPVAVVVCGVALAFALAHLAFSPTLVAAATFVPALALGWVYIKTNSVAACAVLHSVFNLLYVMLASSV